MNAGCAGEIYKLMLVKKTRNRTHRLYNRERATFEPKPAVVLAPEAVLFLVFREGACCNDGKVSCAGVALLDSASEPGTL
jgi:hypothetical protein